MIGVFNTSDILHRITQTLRRCANRWTIILPIKIVNILSNTQNSRAEYVICADQFFLIFF